MKSSLSSPLFFTPEAITDYEDILQHTLEIWGENQSDIYNSKLDKAFNNIRNNPMMGVVREDLLPGYRAFLVGKHTIFYQNTPDKTIVVRILHQSQDSERHL